MAKTISSLNVVLGATVAPFVNAFKGAGNAAEAFGGKVASAGGTILKFTGLAAGIGAIAGAFGGLSSAVKLSAELEQTSIAFETMLGSGQAAQGMMNELQSFAAATPFEFPEIAAAAKKLLGMGVAGGDVKKTLQTLGDIASGTGKDLGELAGIYGKIKSRGQLTGETLNQLAEAGVPIYKNLASTLGIAETQVAAFVTAGKVGFPQVDAALASMTATGGQFSGLMEKQSHSLAGLWSTFTDTISMAMAGLVWTVTNAFNVKDFMAGAIDHISNFAGWLTTTVQKWSPVVVAVFGSIYSSVTSALSALWGYVQPAIASIGALIAGNWQTILATTVGYLSAVYAESTAFMSMIGAIFTAAAGAIGTAWTCAMNLLGVESTNAGATTQGVFQAIGAWAKWFADGVTMMINTAAFGFTHFRDVVESVGIGVAYQIVKLGNEVAYTFTDVIPSLLTWFAGNWRDIFTTLASGTAAIFTNMATNVDNFFSALWGFLKGDGFNFQWTGLLDGFESTIKEMPKIAERQIGPLEKALGDQSAALGDSLGKGLGQYLSDQEQKAKQSTANIAKSIKDLSNLAVAPPVIGPPAALPITANTAPATDAIDAVGAKAKQVSDSLKLVGANSAESMAIQSRARVDAFVASAAAGPKTAGNDKAAQQKQTDLLAQTVALLKSIVTNTGEPAAPVGTVS